MGILDVPPYTRAQVDAKLAALDTGPGRAGLGGTIMGIGDSISSAGWAGDPSDAATVSTGAEAVLAWTVLLSRGRLVLDGGPEVGPSQAFGGHTTRDAIVRHLPVVEARRPDLCVVILGANDLPSIPQAETLANLQTIYDRLRRAGTTPVVCTVPPRTGPPAGLRALNVWLAGYARRQGLPFADLHTVVTDPAGPGLYLPALTRDDGGHPNSAGAKLLGRAIADALAPRLTPTVPLAGHNRSSGTIDRLAVQTENSLFLTPRAGGQAAGWDGAVSLTTPASRGNYATLRRAGGADAALYAYPGGIAAGDRLLFAFELSATAAGGTWGVRLRGRNAQVAGVTGWDQDVPAGSVWAQEVVWPAQNAEPFVVVQAVGADGAAAAVARMVLLNLSAAALA